MIKLIGEVLRKRKVKKKANDGLDRFVREKLTKEWRQLVNRISSEPMSDRILGLAVERCKEIKEILK